MKKEMPDIDRLLRKIKAFQDEGLAEVDLIVTWLDWRVHPL